MRRLKPDPIPLDVQARILDAAIRAPSGGNNQRWRFILVDDAEIKNQLGPLYRLGVDRLWALPGYAARLADAREQPEAPESIAMMRLYRSVNYQAAHFEEAPLLFFGFAYADRSGSSIFPAVWNAMLAARAEGVGSTLTTLISHQEEQVRRILGVPDDPEWRMACCVPMGYPQGKFGVPPRRPAHEVASRNHWDGPLGFKVPEPLWPPVTDQD